MLTGSNIIPDKASPDKVTDVVDEEGLVKGLSENALGCALYGTARHGYPIVGDLIFGIVVGEDIVGPENPEAMIERLIGTFIGLKRV